MSNKAVTVFLENYVTS